MSLKLQSIMSEDLGYNESGKKAFHSEAKKVLRKLAKDLGLSKEEYTVSSNMGGIAVSGEATLHTDNIYVSISQFCLKESILYRTCKSRNDSCGGRNNFSSTEDIISGVLLTKINHLLSE